jgi:Ca2+-binding EF-hand superfamily protein
LAVAMISDDINEAVLEKEEFFDALTDPRMQTLFGLFDIDGNGAVDFKEVAVGLFQLTDDMEDSARTAVTVLLMLDEDDKRTLNFEEFAKLMLHVVTAAGNKFVDMADKMTLAMISTKAVSKEDISNLMCGEALYHLVKDEQEEHRELLETMDALQYGRMQKLFDLWDSDNDGEISFPELLTGMRKFNTSIDMEESVSGAALAMIGFDADRNQSLNRVEFARALVNYAAATEVGVHNLVDFMVMATVLEDDSPEEQAYIRGISNQVNAEIKLVRDMLDDHGIE